MKPWRYKTLLLPLVTNDALGSINFIDHFIFFVKQELMTHYKLNQSDGEREWQSYRALMATNLKHQLVGVGKGLKELLKPGYAQLYPILIKVAAAALVIPVSTAGRFPILHVYTITS